MTRTVAWTDTARRQVFAIVDYIDTNNPDAAERVADQIAATAARLGQFATGHPGRVANTYEHGVARLPYIIVYSIAAQPDASESVIIVQIIHAARTGRPEPGRIDRLGR